MLSLQIQNPMIQNIMKHLKVSMHGKDEALIKILICIFSGGHVLLEDAPGLGKTTLAVSVSKTLGLQFGRIQCTNDLLPSDITGLNIFKPDEKIFEFHPGPIFNNIVLVDEINRATPKTQSALLEAMGEGQATIDGETYQLPNPFIVIATQNPVEHSGTFPLPESQMDRFTTKLSIGYPSMEAELDILRAGTQKAELEKTVPLLNAEKILDIRENIERNILVSEALLKYILSVAEATRSHSDIETGISTRGAMILLSVSKTAAWFQGRNFVVPEDIKIFAEEVLLHRILFKQDITIAAKRNILKTIMDAQNILDF